MTSTEEETETSRWTPHHGALVWGKLRNQRLWWPGIIVGASNCFMRSTKLDHEWVYWFGDDSVSQVPHQNLCEFVPHFKDKYKTRRIPSYSAGVVEAIEACKYRVENDTKKECKCGVTAGLLKKCKCRIEVIGKYRTEAVLLEWAYKDFALPDGTVDFNYFKPDPIRPISSALEEAIRITRTTSPQKNYRKSIVKNKDTNDKSYVEGTVGDVSYNGRKRISSSPAKSPEIKQSGMRKQRRHRSGYYTKRGEPSPKKKRMVKYDEIHVVERSGSEESGIGENSLNETIAYGCDDQMQPDGSNEDSVIITVVRQLTDLNNLQNGRIHENEKRVAHNESDSGISCGTQYTDDNREPPNGSISSISPLPICSAVEGLNDFLMNERAMKAGPVHPGVSDMSATNSTLNVRVADEVIRLLEQRNENVNWSQSDIGADDDLPSEELATRNSEDISLSGSLPVCPVRDFMGHDSEVLASEEESQDEDINHIKSHGMPREVKLYSSTPQTKRSCQEDQPVLPLEIIEVRDERPTSRGHAEVVTKYCLSKRVRNSNLLTDDQMNIVADKSEIDGSAASNLISNESKNVDDKISDNAVSLLEDIPEISFPTNGSPEKLRTNVDDIHSMIGGVENVGSGNTALQSNTTTESWTAGASSAKSFTEKDHHQPKSRSRESRESKTKETHKKEKKVDNRTEDGSGKGHEHGGHRSNIQKKTVSEVQGLEKKMKEEGRRTDKTSATKPHSSTSKQGSDRGQASDMPPKPKEDSAQRKWKDSEREKGGGKRTHEVPVDLPGKTSSMTHGEFLRQRFMNDTSEGGAIDKVRANHLKIDDICIACRLLPAKPVECHPFFSGGICEKCKKKLMKTLYVCGEDGTSVHCTICSEAKQVITCSKRTCNSTFCKKCLKALAGSEEVETILGADILTWHCYLCRDDYEDVDLLAKRDGWQRYVIKLYSPFYYISHKNVSYKIRQMRVLSIFDGIGTGLYVLDKLGLKIERYLAAENDVDAKNVATMKFGDKIKHLSSVENVISSELDRLGQIDLVLANIPYTAAETPEATAEIMKMFHEFHRILRNVQIHNNGHQVFWLFECMTMEKKEQDIMTRFLECEPVTLDPMLIPNTYFGRSFWGNIPGLRATLATEKLGARLSLQEFLVGNSKPRLSAEESCMLLSLPNPSGSTSGADGMYFTASAPEMKSNALYPMQWLSEIVTAYGLNSQLEGLNRLSVVACRRLLRRASSALVTAQILRTLTHFFTCVNDDEH